MGAPGPAAGMLVATHFVYSMALKRKRTFGAFSWDHNSSSRTHYEQGSCWKRAERGILFGHTYFGQMPTKSVLCALPSGQAPECACCAGLPSAKTLKSQALQLETTNGYRLRNIQGHLQKLEGCGDYQLFWD